MRAPIFLLSWLAIAFAGSAVCLAQDDDVAPAESVAPFVDRQTVAVVRIDLAAFDAAKSIDLLTEFLRVPKTQRDRIQADVVPLNVVADALPEGARAEIFFITSLADLATLPMFLVLPAQTVAAEPIALEVRRAAGGELVSETIAGALVTGSPRTIERLKKATPAKRPEIAAAFEAVEGSAVQALLVPAPEALRALEVLVPKLPEALGGGATKELTGSLAWIAVGVDLPPQPTRFRLVVQTTGAPAAEALSAASEKMLAAIAAQPEIRDAAPNAAELAKRLVPKVAGDRLTLELDEAEIGALQPLVPPVLKAAQSLAPRASVKRPATD